MEPLLKYVYEEMGLDDMKLLDLRDMDPPPALGSNLMMLFGTARSERHLHVSSSRLVKWLRYTYRIESRADGLIGPGELKTKLRRLRKKAKLMGSSALPVGEDDGIATGWICVNLGTIGSSIGESAKFDEDGKVSGFGSASLGTTIVVQVMTESRRNELNLEKLWGGQLNRSLESEAALEVDEEEFMRRFGKKPPPLPRAPTEPRNRRKFTSMQKRTFSTSRILSALETTPHLPEETPPPPPQQTRESHKAVDSVVVGGRPITSEEGVELLQQILTPGPDEELTVQDIAIALELLKTMHERGMSVLNNETIVTLIECLSNYKGEDDSLHQMRHNMEYLLMRGLAGCPSNEHLKRLLSAYVARRQWTQFWEVWRIPPRHAQPRSAGLYLFVLRQAAETKRLYVAQDVLRTLVPEMPHEDPPILPIGQIWAALKEVLVIADPACEDMSRSLGSEAVQDMEPWIRERYRREFVRLYRRLERQNEDLRRMGLV